MGFARRSFSVVGVLAQLARALDLHSRGHRFDSDILHKKKESFKPEGYKARFYWKVEIRETVKTGIVVYNHIAWALSRVQKDKPS